MIQNGALLQFAQGMLISSPALLVLAIGFVIALTRLRIYPRPAMLVLAAMIVLLFEFVGLGAAQALIMQLITPDRSPRQIGVIFMVLGLVRTCLFTVAASCLIIAAFVDRREAMVGAEAGAGAKAP